MLSKAVLERMATCLIAGLCLLASAPSGHAANAAAGAELKGYLPASDSLAAEYVVLERDPNFDVYGQRIRAAMEANREWLAAYRTQYAGKELPYHPNFGVSETDYFRYKQPINQFREVSRKRIRIDKRVTGSTVTLHLQGENLLLSELQVEMDTPAQDAMPVGFVKWLTSSAPRCHPACTRASRSTHRMRS
jgi:hypothetical protein